MSMPREFSGTVMCDARGQVEVRQAAEESDESCGLERQPHTNGWTGEVARPHIGRQECPPQADLWLYRDRTVALLRRYARMAVETGRLPSLLGRECFQTRVTPYAMASFEDMVIFVHDIETAMRRLGDFQQQLIALNVLEELSQWEVARMMGCTTRWIEWQVPDALDDLSRILLDFGMLTRETEMCSEGCQEGTKSKSAVSDSNEGKNIL